MSWDEKRVTHCEEREEYEEFYEFMIGWNSRSLGRQTVEIDDGVVWSPSAYVSREFSFQRPNYGRFLEILRDHSKLSSLVEEN